MSGILKSPTGSEEDMIFSRQNKKYLVIITSNIRWNIDCAQSNVSFVCTQFTSNHSKFAGESVRVLNVEQSTTIKTPLSTAIKTPLPFDFL